jgi:hypothetical protein
MERSSGRSARSELLERKFHCVMKSVKRREAQELDRAPPSDFMEKLCFSKIIHRVYHRHFLVTTYIWVPDSMIYRSRVNAASYSPALGA